MGEALLSLAAIAIIIGAACYYMTKAKKSGQKCIGCPNSKGCSGNCSGAQDQPAATDDDDLDLDLD